MRKPDTAVRGRGRPRPIEGADARERLLDAAVTLFAEQGIAATTVARIAGRCGVTPAMVHYYFKSREQLIDAVAEERLSRAVVAVWAPVTARDTDASLLVRGLAQRILQAAEAQPWLPSLWIREVVSEGGELRGRMLQHLPLGQVQLFVAALVAARRRGEVNPGLEPRLVFLSVIGLTLLPLALAGLLQRLPIMQGIGHRELASHAEALLLQGLSVPRDRQSRPRKKSGEEK